MDTTIIIQPRFANYVILLVLHVLRDFLTLVLFAHLCIIIWWKQHHVFLPALSFTTIFRQIGLASLAHPTVNLASMERIAQYVQTDSSFINKNVFQPVLVVHLPIMCLEYA